MQKNNNGSRRRFNNGFNKRHNRNNHQSNRRRNRSRNNKKSSKIINSNHFINKAIKQEKQATYIAQNSFDDFLLNRQTKANLTKIGYQIPSPIQDQSIPIILEGLDLIGLANTGTGKTAAFLLPTIEKLAANKDPISALILAPTRELAHQIDEEFKKFANKQNVFSVLVVGGTNIGRQIKKIKDKPQIIIGTPGRVNDLIERKILKFHNISTFILDEADRMCDMGFVNDIRKIGKKMPKNRQTLCFSATMTNAVTEIVKEFMKDPKTVSVVKNATNDHIEQDIIREDDKIKKIEILTDLLIKPEFEKVIVFGRTKHGVQRLSEYLNKNNLPSVAIHGNKSQSQRTRALKTFKSNDVNIMVATDVAARGLDIPNVSHVINFDAPEAYEDYVHRIGRTGRAGKKGTALTFVKRNQ